MNKSILDTVHESAKALHDAGVMNDVTLRQFDTLCLPPTSLSKPPRQFFTTEITEDPEARQQGV